MDTQLIPSIARELQRVYNLSKEKALAISDLIKFASNNQCNSIKEKLHLCNDDLKFNWLSYVYRYMKEINVIVSPEVRYYIHTEVLRIKCFGPRTYETDSNKKISKNVSLLKELLQKPITTVIDWNKPTNSILLYHIRQIILLANQIRYNNSEYKRWPWTETIFYLQQFIKISTSYNPINTFLHHFISRQKIANIFGLLKSVLESKKAISMLLKSKHNLIDELIYDYGVIRNMSSLNIIIEHFDYLSKYKEYQIDEKLDWFVKMRILQVLGEHLNYKGNDFKITHDLKTIIDKHTNIFIGVDELINLRHDISHETCICIQWNKYNKYLKVGDYGDIFRGIRYNYFVSELNKIEKVDLNILKQCLDNKDWTSNKKFYKPESNSTRENDFQNQVVDNNYCKTLKYALYYEDPLALEMKLLITLNYLDDKQHFNTKSKYSDKYYTEIYPILTGKTLRNHLAHGDPIVATLDIDDQMAIRTTTKFIIMNWNKFENKELDIRIETDKIIYYFNMQGIESSEILENVEQFMELIRTSDLQSIKLRISELGTECINWRTHEDQTALHGACYNNDANVLKYLIKKIRKEKNENMIGFRDINGNTILHLASTNNNVDAVEFILIDESCKILTSQEYITNENKQTPFHLASKSGNDKIITLLISNGLSRYARNKDIFDNCSMMYSTMKGNIIIVKLLSKYCTQSIRECLSYAYEMEDIDIVEYLIQLLTDFSIPIRTNAGDISIKNINNIIISKKVNLADELLQQKSKQLLHIVNHENINSLNEFITENPGQLRICNPTDGKNVMHYAVENGNMDMIKLIYENIPYLLFLNDMNELTPIKKTINSNNNQLLNDIVNMIINTFQNRPNFLNSFLRTALDIVPLSRAIILKIHDCAMKVIDDPSSDEYLYESALLLFQEMLKYSTHEALGEIRSRAFYRFVQNVHVSEIWVKIVLDISEILMDPIPLLVLDRVKDCLIISKMLQTFVYTNRKHVYYFDLQKIDQMIEVKFPIEKRNLFELLISNVSSADYYCNLDNSQRFVLRKNIKRILDQSEPIERKKLLQILINKVIHGNSKRTSQLLLIDIIVHYYGKNDINMEDFLTILDFSGNVAIQNIVLYLVFQTITVHKFMLDRKYYKELLIIAVHNLHAFWMSEDTMRVCIALIMHIKDISWEADSCETDLRNSLSNIPTFNEYLKFYRRTNDKSKKSLLQSEFELDYGQENETDLKYYKKNMIPLSNFHYFVDNKEEIIQSTSECVFSNKKSKTDVCFDECFSEVLKIIKAQEEHYSNISTKYKILNIPDEKRYNHKIDVLFPRLFKNTEFKIEDKELAKPILGKALVEYIGYYLEFEMSEFYKHFSHDTLDLVHVSIQKPGGNIINARLDAAACILYAIRKIDEIDYDNENIWDKFEEYIYLLIIFVSWYYGPRRGYKFIQTVAAITYALTKSPKAKVETKTISIKIKILKMILNSGFTDGREDIYDIVNGLLKELEIEFDVISEFNYDDEIDFDWIDYRPAPSICARSCGARRLRCTRGAKI